MGGDAKMVERKIVLKLKGRLRKLPRLLGSHSGRDATPISWQTPSTLSNIRSEPDRRDEYLGSNRAVEKSDQGRGVI